MTRRSTPRELTLESLAARGRAASVKAEAKASAPVPKGPHAFEVERCLKCVPHPQLRAIVAGWICDGCGRFGTHNDDGVRVVLGRKGAGA
jgi:hypothetical protein